MTARTIGAVISELAEEFPDLRESKVRYLEAQGLLTPTRTSAGYRTYSSHDVDTLRSILRLQRDNFWPLRVIREHLDQPAPTADAAPRPQRPVRRGQRISASTLQSRSGIDARALSDLVSFGLVSPDSEGRFDDSVVEVCEVVAALAGFGIEPRHLRSARVAADREVGLVRQALAGLDAKGAEGRQRRAAAQADVVGLVVSLHEALIRTGLSQG